MVTSFAWKDIGETDGDRETDAVLDEGDREMSARQRIRIATAQYPIDKLPDMAAVRDKLGRWVAEAADGGAELLVFPEYGAMELAAIAGDAIAADVAASLKAVSDALPEVDAIHADLARRHGVHILAASGPLLADGPLRQCGAAHHARGPHRRAGQAHHDAVRAGLGYHRRSSAARVRDRARPDRHRYLLRQRVSSAGAGASGGRRGAHPGAVVHRARLGRASCAYCRAGPGAGEYVRRRGVAHGRGGDLVRHGRPQLRTLPALMCRPKPALSDTGVLAEGQLNAPGWVFADIDLQALRTLQTRGEMRNAQDWTLQPGASPAGAACRDGDAGLNATTARPR